MVGWYPTGNDRVARCQKCQESGTIIGTVIGLTSGRLGPYFQGTAGEGGLVNFVVGNDLRETRGPTEGEEKGEPMGSNRSREAMGAAPPSQGEESGKRRG